MPRLITIALLFSLLFGLSPNEAIAQIDRNNITIYRDIWGVPHIHARSDEELAYGLAWATAEDDFGSIQENLLIARSRLSEVKGKKGAIYDVFCFLLGIQEYVDTNYETEVPDHFKKILTAYTTAINRYAEQHPKEVLVRRLFPATEKDMMVGYVLGMSLITNIGDELAKIFSGSIAAEINQPRGSNGIAISPSRTNNGKTFLVLNSHQPLTGPYSWYEAHLINDNMNIHGATFPGGTSLYIGANHHLGWGHTVNHPDFTDIYKLEMHPDHKLKYTYDGEWKTLEERKLKLKVKFGFIKIPITRKFYWSAYGPTIKTDNGFYSIRSAAYTEMRHAAQWFDMNKAKSFSEFRKILDQQGHSGTNLIYADAEGHIFHLSNGLLPIRPKGFQWDKVLKGNTSANNWAKKYYPIDSLVQVLNPPSGYLYNTNNSPLVCTASEDNPNPDDYNPDIGYLREDNNRSRRLDKLLAAEDTYTYERIKAIKNDRQWDNPLFEYTATDLNMLCELEKARYPDLSEIIDILENWDFDSQVTSEGAAIVSLLIDFYLTDLYANGLNASVKKMTESKMVEYLRRVKKQFEKHFGTVHVQLGDLQRHVRGKVDLPMGGTPWVLSAVYSEPYKKGRLHVDGGESFIQMVQFGEDGPVIETINAYGASANPESPHYTDQMELFVNQQLKPMTLDLDQVKKEAVRHYHPG